MDYNACPLGNLDILLYGIGEGLLGPQDINCMTEVCKEWHGLVEKNKSAIWKAVCQNERIPLVEGERCDYRKDYYAIKPLVSSVHGLFGDVLGAIPQISLKTFQKLTSNELKDPFGNGLFKRNFVLFIEPSYIGRHFDKETPLALLEDGRLIQVSPDEVIEGTYQIPAHLSNLLMLARFPLKGKEHAPVYNGVGVNWSHRETSKCILEQCVDFPEKVGLHLMRKTFASFRGAVSFEAQENFLKNESEKALGEEYRVESARRRFLFDAECILNTGTCPEECNERDWTVLRSSESIIDSDGNKKCLCIEMFVPGKGLSLSSFAFSAANNCFVVVPSGPAEALRPSEVERLALKFGDLAIDRENVLTK